MRLFHFTCHHARAKIIRDQVLRPNERSYGQLIWLTDLADPDALSLGLTSFMLRCDRMAYRISVETDQCLPWTTWAHQMKVPTTIRLVLDGNPGAQSRHWWVSTTEIPILGIEPTFNKARTKVKAP